MCFLMRWVSPGKFGYLSVFIRVNPWLIHVNPWLKNCLPESGSVLALRQFTCGLRLLENALFHYCSLRQFLLGHNGFDRVEELRTNQWIAFDGAIQFARRHRFKRAVNSINR